MIHIVPYKTAWQEEFTGVGAEIRAALGDTALAVHHIGSTSVPGLAAKDVIDVQATIANLDVLLKRPLETAGFIFRNDIRRDHAPPGMTLGAGDLEKRYFQRSERPVHLHIRAAGRFNQRYALLCRDFYGYTRSQGTLTVKSRCNLHGISRMTKKRITLSKTRCLTC